MSQKVKIRFGSANREVIADSEETVFNAALRVGVDTGGVCGGRGFCGKCKVKILGKTSEITEVERKFLTEKELKEGIRLACQTHPLGEVNVEPLYTKVIKFAKIGYEPKVSISPAVSLELHGDNMLVKYFKDKKVEVLDVLKTPEKSIYGMAIDIGTTKIVIYVVDLTTGTTVITDADENPQTIFGADVITRIMKSLELGVENLHKVLIDYINEKIRSFEIKGISANSVYDIVVVGNSVMHHFFLGKDVRTLAYAPYRLNFKSSMYVKAKNLKIATNPNSYVYLPPLVESFVGSDSLVGAYVMSLKSPTSTYLFMDIGTNAEVFLSHKGKVFAASGPAGPAFEGMNIKFGMRAAKGAIEGVAIEPDTLEPRLKVIGNTLPCGITGSGLIDAVAEMLRNGIIDYSGRFRIKEHPRITCGESGLEYILSRKGCNGRTITITQKDIREIQLAKAAVQTTIRILLQKAKLKVTDIEKVYVAGSFGLYIHPLNAITIGLLPEVSLEKIEFVGNTAGSGARLLLKNRDMRKKIEEYAKLVEHVDLVLEKEFHRIFINSMYLPSAYLDEYPITVRELERILGKPHIKKI